MSYSSEEHLSEIPMLPEAKHRLIGDTGNYSFLLWNLRKQREGFAALIWSDQTQWFAKRLPV